MRTKFDDAMDFVFLQEGGLTEDPKDPGGLTNFGISQKSYPALDIRNLTKEQAKAIYYKDFWTPLRCEDLPYGLSLGLFDMGVNQGTGTAIKILQRTLGVKDDGIFGPKTMEAAQKAEPRSQTLLLARRLVAYHELMKTKPNLEVFALNWFHRVVELTRTL